MSQATASQDAEFVTALVKSYTILEYTAIALASVLIYNSRESELPIDFH